MKIFGLPTFRELNGLILVLLLFSNGHAVMFQQPFNPAILTPVVAAAGGGGGCVAGTTLVGTDTIGSERPTLDSGVGNHTLPFTASASGTPATGEMYGRHTVTNNAKIVIYGPTGTKLCESASTSIGESDAWQSVSFSGSGCPSLSASTTYTLLWVSNGFFVGAFNTFATWDNFKPAGTVASPPASITPGTADGGDEGHTHPMSIRIKC